MALALVCFTALDSSAQCLSRHFPGADVRGAAGGAAARLRAVPGVLREKSARQIITLKFVGLEVEARRWFAIRNILTVSAAVNNML
jgi:hypothetical protein